MSIINPYTLSGFEVLLVETDKKKVLHHTYILFQNSYRVSSSMKISDALSKISNRQTFDCVLIDAEMRDMNLKEFIHNIWIYQPQIRIIVINSTECHMQLVDGNLKNNAIWFLSKPTGVNSICNTLQHVCLSKVLQGTSTGKLLEENQKRTFFQNVPSPSLFNLMINNNTSSSNGTHQGLNINKQRYDAMCKRVSHVDISSDDDVDEASTNKRIRIGDRGKKPMELKRKSEPQAEVDINLQRRKDIISRVGSTPMLFRNNLEPLTSFGKEGAHPKEIRNPINMPDRTRAQVPSPLHEVMLGSMKKNTDWQTESYKFKTSGQSTAFDNNASMQNSSNIQRAINVLNSNATSFETFNKTMAWGGPQLSLPPCTTTLIGNTFMSSDFALTGNSHGGGNENLQAPVSGFGIPDASHLTVGGEGEASSYAGLDDVTLPHFTFQEFEDVFHPQPFLGIGEALVGFLNSDTANIGQASTSVSPLVISGVENNSTAEPSGDSILPFQDSEGRVIDNDWYLSLIHDFDL